MFAKLIFLGVVAAPLLVGVIVALIAHLLGCPRFGVIATVAVAVVANIAWYFLISQINVS